MLPDTLVESLRQQIHDLPVKKKYFPKPKASEAEVGDHEGKKKEKKKKDKDKKKKKKKEKGSGWMFQSSFCLLKWRACWMAEKMRGFALQQVTNETIDKRRIRSIK